MTDREYEPIADDERDVDLDDAAEATLPPPTLDPEERVEVEEAELAPDADRPVA